MIRRALLAGACIFALSGCTWTAEHVTDLATSVSSSTPTTINSAKGANDAFTLLAHGADVYVTTAHPPVSTIRTIEAYRIGLKSALDDINRDVAAGNSPVYDAFNDALKAWENYNTTKGIAQ